MSTPQPESGGPGSLRVGDAERTSALDALAEHLAAGRLTLDEYGDRSAKVTVARTADDLAALFDDLPAPHPAAPAHGASVGLATVASTAALPTASAPAAGGVGDARSTAQKLVGVASAASVFVAVALFFITGSWLWFLLIPGISAAAGAIWGPDWKQSRPVDRSHHRELGRGRGHHDER